MKKLMIAAAATLCAAVGFSTGVESQNIVGYNTTVADASDGESAFPIIGLCFTPVGGGDAKLGDFKPNDGTMSLGDDNLQVIDPESLDASLVFMYCDKTTADAIASERGLQPGDCDDLIGWWDAWDDIGAEGASMNNYPVTPGFGFMGFFYGGTAIEFQSAGEVPTVPTKVTTDGESPFPILVNYLPKDLTLGQIQPKDGTMSLGDDNIQVISAITLDADAVYMYCDKTTADAIASERGLQPGDCDDLIGWWDAWDDIGAEGASKNDESVPAGSGFMGFFYGGQPIEFQIPSALD